MRARPWLSSLALALAAVSAFACGAGSGAHAPSAAPDSTTAEGAGDGGATGAIDAGPVAKPFAGSAVEATQLIGDAVDKGSVAVHKCIAEYRTRKNMPHERVTISMGIDQEGRLLGATLPRGKVDRPLSECVQRALANAPFPRSHSGVISITKSYEEIVQ